MQLITAIASARAENIAGQTLAVGSDECGVILIDHSFDQGEVMRAVKF